MPERHWVPAERQPAAGLKHRYVALTDELMTVGEVLEWLELRGLVQRVASDDPEGAGYELRGWGSTYFAVPHDRAVADG